MEMIYELFEEELIIENNCKYTAYGVKHVPTGRSISDITLDKTKLTGFVEIINKSDLDVIHFVDVVEDFLVDLQ